MTTKQEVGSGIYLLSVTKWGFSYLLRAPIYSLFIFGHSCYTFLMRFAKKHFSIVGILFILLTLFGPVLFPASKSYAASRDDMSVRGTMVDRSKVNVYTFNLGGDLQGESYKNLPDDLIENGTLTTASLREIIRPYVIGDWIDSNIGDRTYDYEITHNECTSKMELRYADGEQKFRLLSLNVKFDGFRGGSCQDILEGNLELTDWIVMQPGFDTWFTWKNSTQMTRVDGWGGDWTQSAQFPDRYISAENPSKVVTSVRDGFSWGDYADKVGGDMNGNESDFIRIANVTAREAAGPPPGSVTEDQEDDNSCESKGSALGWIMCPVILLFDGALNWLDSQIQGLLEIDTDKYTNDNLRAAWINFRNIAYAILVPILLIMVIGTALGFEVFSAYTVKKALPRMAIAVIFITLSWYITSFLIEVFNLLGGGILGLMTQPFGISGNMNLATLFSASTDNGGDVASTAASAGIQWGAGSAVLVGLGVLATSSGGLGIIMLYLGSALLFVMTAFVVLVLRQMFIIALILIAPIAILAWIFPGNDKMWKLWWGTFSKLLMMFPLIMLVIASGRIFAHLFMESGGGGLDSVIIPLLALTAYVVPYLLIPFTFKFAGGVFANLSGMINDRERGLFDRMRKSRGEKFGDMNERRKQGNLYKNAPDGSRRARLNDRIERLSNIGAAGYTLNRENRAARLNTSLANSAYDEAAEAREKNQALRAVLGNDDYLEAGRTGVYTNSAGQQVRRDGSEASVRAYLADKGYDAAGQAEGAALIRAARSSMSGRAFDIAASIGISGTGTGYGNGIGELYNAINETAGSDRALANRMLADTRGMAEKARRPDLVASGFGASSKMMQQVYEGGITSAEATQIQDESTLHTQDPRMIISGKSSMIERLAPTMQAEISDALGSGDEVVINTMLAKYAAMYDQMSHVSPQNAQVMADNVMSASVGDNLTVQQAIESARTNQRFVELRREYNSRWSADQNQGPSPEPPM